MPVGEATPPWITLALALISAYQTIRLAQLAVRQNREEKHQHDDGAPTEDAPVEAPQRRSQRAKRR